jgi:hypothetical protein
MRAGRSRHAPEAGGAYRSKRCSPGDVEGSGKMRSAVQASAGTTPRVKGFW